MKNKIVDPQAPDLYWIEGMARLMDSKFKIPGTKFRFGLDPILGIFPVIGDVTAFAISGGLVIYMMRHGVSRKVVILMLINIALDALIGSIPLIGHVFDFYYKANNRNIRLLKKHYVEGKHQGKGTGLLIVVVTSIISFIFLMIWGLWSLLNWIPTLFT